MDYDSKKTTGLYKTIVEHIQELVMLTRVDGSIFYISPACKQLLGFEASELVNSRPDMVHPEDRGIVRAAQERGRRGEHGADLEYRIETKDGAVRWVSHSWWPIEEDGELRLIVNVIRDVTKHKEAENDLADSERRYRALVETSFDGYFLVDTATARMIYVNDGLRESFGYSAEETHDLSLWELIDPRDHDRVRKRMAARIAGEALPKETAAYRAFHKDGSIRNVEVSNALVMYKGKPAIQGVVHDLTDSIKLQRQLLHTQKMEAIGKLAGGIAHDFNNLLMGIQGTASLLMRELSSDHPQRTLVEHIERYARNGTGLTRQLLGFASGQTEQTRAMNLSGLLTSSAGMFGRTKKEISVSVDCQGDLRPISANRGQIEQALLNLYLNAWQAMPGGGELEIIARNVEVASDESKLPSGDYVEVMIRDTGEGMSPEVLDRIFDPFFTTKEMGRGTGLGLASVYTIVRSHGGSIVAESKPRFGSTFTMLLPCTAIAPSETGETGEDVERGRERVLLVDDEIVSLTTCSKMLEHLGYDVIIARSGKEALDVFEREEGQVDLVLLDMVMPGMSGGATFDALRERAPELKVVLCSGYSEGEAAKVLSRGCAGFLQKPFTLKTLSIKVKSALREDG